LCRQSLPHASRCTAAVLGKRLGQVDFVDVGCHDDVVALIDRVVVDCHQLAHTHTIEAPVEAWKAQQDSGEVAAPEIIDQNNVKTILTL
jgi:hypothetical protein